MKSPQTCLNAYVAAASLWLCASVSAQQFVVSTALKGNTYDQMFRELAAECQKEVGVPFVGSESTGSMRNVDRLIKDEVRAAIVQTDVLHFRARTDELSRLKALFALHPEEVHVVTLSADRKEHPSWLPGWWRWPPEKTVRFNTLTDLRDRRVGAWGGSYVTAEVIGAQAEISFHVIEVADQDAALKALNDGSIDAVVSVGGSPLGWIQKLDRRYKLLAIGEVEISKLKTFYRQAPITYSNMGQIEVRTVATDAIMVTLDYTQPDLVNMLRRVRGCLRDHLHALQAKPGNHPKWLSVDRSARPKWPLYDPSSWPVRP